MAVNYGFMLTCSCPKVKVGPSSSVAEPGGLRVNTELNRLMWLIWLICLMYEQISR